VKVNGQTIVIPFPILPVRVLRRVCTLSKLLNLNFTRTLEARIAKIHKFLTSLMTPACDAVAIFDFILHLREK